MNKVVDSEMNPLLTYLFFYIGPFLLGFVKHFRSFPSLSSLIVVGHE